MHDPLNPQLRPMPPLSADTVIRPPAVQVAPPPPSSRNSPLLGRVRRISRVFAFCTLLSLVILALCEYVAAPAFGLLLDLLELTYFPAFMEIAEELFLTGLYFVAFLLPYLLYANLCGFQLRMIPHRRVHRPVLLSCTGLAMGASHLGLILTAVLLLVASLFGLNPPDLPIIFPTTPIAWILMVLNMTVLPAVVEELIFRGIVLHSLRPFGNLPALLISSLFFGLMHRNMLQFSHAFVLGLVLGYVVIQTGSVYTGMFIHFINNLIAVLLSVAAEHMNPIAVGLLSFTQLVLYLCAAIAGLLYLCAVRRAVWKMPASPPDTPPPAQILKAFFKNIPMILTLLLFVATLWSSFTFAS